MPKRMVRKKYNVNTLNELIELLYQKTDAKTRESILILQLCQEDEFNSVEKETA